MVSFQCNECGDVVKKPKLPSHRCRSSFTCLDCSTTFHGQEYRSHTSCISEAEKYQKSLYKGKNKGNGNSKNQNNNNNKKPVNQGNGNNAKKPEVQNSNNNAKEPVKENGNSSEKKANKEDGNAKEKKTNNRDGKAKGNKAESSNNEKKKDNEDGNTKENKAEGNSKKDKKKPISLVEELKQKQEKTGEKRKREEEEGEDGGKKIKAESTSSWQETELPGEDDKVILLAIKVALESSKGALTLKEARKKAIKLIQSHPKAKTTNKKELKDKFEDVLTLQLANDTITVKTVQ